MGLFDHFPYTNVHELNLDWILSMMKALEAEWEAFTAGNSLTFADPLQHDISKTYAKNTIVLDSNGNAYVSLQTVPVGVGLQNSSYWLMVFDYEAFIEKVNKNFTARYYRGSYRATAAMAIGDWLTVDDILCKATAAIAVDDILEIGVNIEHFTLEDFIKAFMQSANQLIQQYKNDIDASELAYRNQLAQDIANTTASLQAQLDAAISGATVDSEVINARVGWDSITYPNLGDAIRTQISELETDKELLYDGMAALNWSEYSRGTLNYGVPTAANYRIKTTNIANNDYPTKFTCDAGYKFDIIFYNADQSYKTETGWITAGNFFYIEANSYYRLLIAADPEDTSAVVDVKQFARAVKFQTYIGSVSEITTDIFSYLNTAASFIRGTLSATGAYQANITRIVSDNFIVPTRNISLHIKSGYRFLLSLYDNSNVFIRNTNWFYDSTTIKAGQHFKITIAREVETADPSQIGEFSKGLVCYNLNDDMVAFTDKVNTFMEELKYSNKLAIVKSQHGAILDTINKQFFFPRGGELILGTTSKLLTPAMVVDLSTAINSSSIVMIYYDLTNNAMVAAPFNQAMAADRYLMLAVVSFYKVPITIGYAPSVLALFHIEIDPYSKAGQGYGTNLVNRPADHTAEGLAHMGYCPYNSAPEDSIVSIVRAKEEGFSAVELDIRFTSDDIPVMIHDGTINRVAREPNGDPIATPVYVYANTLADLNQYDYGIRIGSQYAGYPLNTLAEILACAKSIGLHLYLELKGNDVNGVENDFTASQIQIINNLVHDYNMEDCVSYTSFVINNLSNMRMCNDRARLLYVNQQPNFAWTPQSLMLLQSGKNEVCLSYDVTRLTQTIIDDCKDHNIPLYVWVVDNENDMTALDPYIKGVYSDLYNYPEVLKAQYITP